MDVLSGFAVLIFSILGFIAFILIMRLLGAWMMRINEIIRYQLETLKYIKQAVRELQISNGRIELKEKNESSSEK